MAARPRTVTDIRTPLRSKLRLKSLVEGSEFLEIFHNEKSKIRLEQEKDTLSRRVANIDEEISSIEASLKKLNEIVKEKKQSEQGEQGYTAERVQQKRHPPPKSKKMMTIDY